MITTGLFTSNTDEWYTPIDFYNQLDKEFHFNLDPCATDENHKCDKYFTKEVDGLSQKWGGIEFFVIPHMAELSGSGLKKRMRNQKKKKLLW